jgi:HAE1 family hydrophobic/amphiphilic exporter-1
MTMNLTSLMGLTLAIGMIVDDAIVVIESIYRKLLVSLPPLEAAVQGTEEVASAVIASTLTTLAVFVPLLFVDGMAGILFRDLALTLIISMAVSLLSAMTLVPVLASRVLKVVPLAKQNIEPGQLDDISLADLEVVTGWKPLDFVAKQIQNALQWMDGGYARLSAWALDHVKWVIAGAVGLLVGSFALVVLLGIEFLPETDDAFFIVNFEFGIKLHNVS